MNIRDYQDTDETSWIRCRVLSFLNTAYFDNVLTKKEHYENPSIELVAVHNGKIVGLMDIEYEETERAVCSEGTGLGGMIWHIAVHPDFYRKGIGESLLIEAENRAKHLNLNRFEAWTRDDRWVQSWYRKMGFQQAESYYHVYLEGNQLKEKVSSTTPHMQLVTTFAHYTCDDIEQFKKTENRIHECVCFEKQLTTS